MGEHDKLGTGVVHHRLDPGFLLRLTVPGDRQMVEGHTAQIEPFIGLARMIGNDADHVYRQFADPSAVEQIGKAVVESGDEQKDFVGCIGVPDRSGHAMVIGKRAEMFGQHIQAICSQGE